MPVLSTLSATVAIWHTVRSVPPFMVVPSHGTIWPGRRLVCPRATVGIKTTTKRYTARTRTAVVRIMRNIVACMKIRHTVHCASVAEQQTHVTVDHAVYDLRRCKSCPAQLILADAI